LPCHKKVSAEIVEIMLDYRPTFLQKKAIEVIWSRGFVYKHISDNVVDFLFLN
jgi:hypothetical protein